MVWPTVATIEVYRRARWQVLGTVTLLGSLREGVRARTRFDYAIDYVAEVGLEDDAAPHEAATVTCPVSFEPYDFDSWPPFLLDLVPQGTWREVLEKRLKVSGDSAFWPLLLHGAGNPPGNLRIQSAAPSGAAEGHPGFPEQVVAEQGRDFLEYARETGAPVSGSSGAQGQAPKYLLRRDRNQRWHANGALSDADTELCAIVKFPRTDSEIDRLILQTECAYWQVARWFGLQVAEPLRLCQDALFVPRFDRVCRDGVVLRRGLESLCSAADFAEFSASIPQRTLLETIARHSVAPQLDIEEFLRRDVLNLALGNVDNHARNSALLKSAGEDDDADPIRLSPLFDFAPMYLDSRRIVRLCRWKDEKTHGPDWVSLFVDLEQAGHIGDARALRDELAEKLTALPQALIDHDVPQRVREDRRTEIDAILKTLETRS